MAAIVGRVGDVDQPKEGYLPPKLFQPKVVDQDFHLLPSETENLPSSLIGICVKCLTRLWNDVSVEEAFYVGLKGYQEFLDCHDDPEVFHKWFPDGTPMYEPVDDANDYVWILKAAWKTKGWSEIVYAAANIAKYEVVFRGGWFRELAILHPNTSTIKNIQAMVCLFQTFLVNYGPVTIDGLNFRGGFTSTIESGTGAFTTPDTIWDLRANFGDNKREHTLLILVYYIMGCRSNIGHLLKNIQYLGIYNPRLNRVYRLKISEIEPQVIKNVTHDVIGYGDLPDEVNPSLQSDCKPPIVGEWLQIIGAGGSCFLVSDGKSLVPVVGNESVRWKIYFAFGEKMMLVEEWHFVDGNWKKQKLDFAISLWSAEIRQQISIFFGHCLGFTDQIEFDLRYSWLKK